MMLFDHVAERLEQEAVRFAVIGAGALAMHEVSVSTLDQELLVTDRRVLNRQFWRTLPPSVDIDAQAGAADDPWPGRVRLAAAADRPVGILIGRGTLMDGILARRIIVPVPGRDLPVASLPDIILLKLFAAGDEDLSEITQVLAAADAPGLRQDVESRLSFLPAACAMLWQQLLTAR